MNDIQEIPPIIRDHWGIPSPDITGWFPHFIRSNFSMAAADLTNEELIEFGEVFMEYLVGKCNKYILEKIIPSGPLEIIIKQDDMFRFNGYHPALLIHLTDFINLKKLEV